MSPAFTESAVEQAALDGLVELGRAVQTGPEMAPGEPAAERDDYGQVLLTDRLRASLTRHEEPNLLLTRAGGGVVRHVGDCGVVAHHPTE